jgi:hypothetical protein
MYARANGVTPVKQAAASARRATGQRALSILGSLIVVGGVVL